MNLQQQSWYSQVSELTRTHDYSSALSMLDTHFNARYKPEQQAYLYYQAGLIYAAMNDLNQACFLITQAFVLAIDSVNSEIEQLSSRFLKKHHRL